MGLVLGRPQASCALHWTRSALSFKVHDVEHTHIVTYITHTYLFIYTFDKLADIQ